jgi:hypothetical protein
MRALFLQSSKSRLSTSHVHFVLSSAKRFEFGAARPSVRIAVFEFGGAVCVLRPLQFIEKQYLAFFFLQKVS